MLDFGEAVRLFYGNYANPEGRAQRSAYWWPVLYQLIIYTVLTIILFMADGGDQLWELLKSAFQGNTEAELGDDFQLGASGIFAFLLLILFGLANVLPNIMVQIRRFHDLGQTGWLVLAFAALGALPGVGLVFDIAHIVWFTRPGTEGSNQYGPDPLRHDPDVFG